MKRVGCQRRAHFQICVMGGYGLINYHMDTFLISGTNEFKTNSRNKSTCMYSTGAGKILLCLLLICRVGGIATIGAR